MKNKQLPKSFEWVNRLKKYEGNPIIRPHGKWAADLIFNPAAVVKDDMVWLLCRCVNLADKRRNRSWSVSSLVWARSNDGINFVLDDEPFLYADENCEYRGGYEDPRIVYIPEEKLYVLTYTGVDYKDDGSLYAPGLLATSKDLESWEFFGEKFPSRAICIINKKINGRYWGYFGNALKEQITWSEDLINWHCDGDVIFSGREGHFDASLCEGACAPIVSDDGVLFIYNGAAPVEKAKEYSNKCFGMSVYAQHHIYSTGWALIDKNDPTKLIAQSENPFLEPYESFECYGLVSFTIFSGGYVHFKGKHYLYYGACDTRIGVAVASDDDDKAYTSNIG